MWLKLDYLDCFVKEYVLWKMIGFQSERQATGWWIS